MTDEDILRDLQHIFKEALNDNEMQIDFNTSQENTAKWDSLANMRLVLAIEEHFSFRFSTSQMETIKSVRDIVRCVRPE